mgnify:CR=1 FL=1
MRKTIMRMQHSQLLKGWSPWLNMVEQQRALERKLHTDKKTDKLPGMGSVMLSAVRAIVGDVWRGRGS